MPYAIRFTRPVATTNRDQYVNECCIGGDLVLDQLLPSLRERYGNLESNQEDWGWFVWFEHSGLKLAVDVFTDDAAAGQFQIRLTSRRRRFLLTATVADTAELEDLRELVVARLRAWPVADLDIEHVGETH